MPVELAEGTLEWYAIRTRSNCEQKVKTLLTSKDVETYLPVFREVRQWKDRKKVIELPVFSSYLFAHLPATREAQLTVLRTDGVMNILGHGENMESIPEKEILSVRQLLDTSTDCYTHPLLREGAWVRVKKGSLKGLEGLLVRLKNQTRLVVSICLLSQSVSAEIDAADVEFVRSAAMGKTA